MDIIKRLGFPLVILVGLAVISKYYYEYANGVGGTIETIYIIIQAVGLVWLGIKLNKENNQKMTLRKLFAIVTVLVLLFMQLKLVELSFIRNLFQKFGISDFYYLLLYVFCGFVYSD